MREVQYAMKASGLAQQSLTIRAEKRLPVARGNGMKIPKTQLLEQRANTREACWGGPTKREFIGTLTHELRVPIQVIVGFADLILDGACEPLHEKQRAMVVKMKQSACYLFDLISDLLELNRIDGEQAEAQYDEIDIRRFLEEVKAMTDFMPKTEGVVLEVETPSGIPMLFSDSRKLKIIMRNLVGNAVKFTQKGQVTIGAHFDPEEEMMVLSVRDTGIGIDEKDRRRIFDMFWQGDKSHPRPFGGVGLGLHIVNRLADQVGARIEVEGEKGKGSLFRVRIPIGPH